MNLKLKLTLPPLIGLVLIILLIQIYWQPLQLERSKVEFKQDTHDLLSTAEAEIVEHLLEGDLGALYSSIENMQKIHEDHWQNISLYTESGKQIYPVFKRSSTELITQEAYIHIIHPLTLNNENLGHIEVDANWRKEKLIVTNDIAGIRNMIISLIAVSLLISLLSQYKMLFKPLKKLTIAANNITHGRLSTELPPVSNDEIGDLSSSFKIMLVELAYQKNALDYHAIVSSTDKHGVITHVNNKFLALSGYNTNELIGRTHSIVKSNTHSPTFYQDLWETITQGQVWHGEICNRKKSGELYWVSSTIVPFLDKNGVPERYMSIRTDITKQKESQEQLSYLANHDTLTGLPTRRLAKENLSQAIALARRENKKAAVLFIDLDGFKAINDNLGHGAGDLLLISVANRLTQTVREVDTVARIGGDEFIIILSGIHSPEDAAIVAQKVIDALTAPFALNEETASISASLGIALYPDHEQTPEALLQCADKTMYAVKKSGKNNFATYEET